MMLDPKVVADNLKALEDELSTLRTRLASSEARVLELEKELLEAGACADANRKELNHRMARIAKLEAVLEAGNFDGFSDCNRWCQYKAHVRAAIRAVREE